MRSSEAGSLGVERIRWSKVESRRLWVRSSGMDDASDLQGGKNYCKELLRRFYTYWDNTFDTVEKDER